MTFWFSLCLDAGAAAFGIWIAAFTPPRDRSATVTDIREGHAIRARRAKQKEGRS